MVTMKKIVLPFLRSGMETSLSTAAMSPKTAPWFALRLRTLPSAKSCSLITIILHLAFNPPISAACKDSEHRYFGENVDGKLISGEALHAFHPPAGLRYRRHAAQSAISILLRRPHAPPPRPCLGHRNRVGHGAAPYVCAADRRAVGI